MTIAAAAVLAVWIVVLGFLFAGVMAEADHRRREANYAKYLNRKHRILAERYGFRSR
jgi:uncharacterized membrane protein